MTDTDFKVQWSVSLPPAAQYAKGHMLNVRGASVEEVEQQFDEILEGKFIDKASDVAALLVAAQIVTEGTKRDSATDKSSSTTQSEPASADSGEIRTCEHGKRVFKSGEKNGKRWSGYFCPERNRNSQCDPVWE